MTRRPGIVIGCLGLLVLCIGCARHAMDRDERSNGEGRCGGLIMAELSDKTPRVGTDSMPPTQTFLKESGRTGANGQGVGFPQ